MSEQKQNPELAKIFKFLLKRTFELNKQREQRILRRLQDESTRNDGSHKRRYH